MSTMEALKKEASRRGACSLTMKVGKFQATLMRAERLPDRGHPHSLPPGSPISVIPVDRLPGVPKSWIGGPGSYVCPVDSECGLWFDWTMNDKLNTAVLASVKGMNPITGQKIESLALNQYQEKCPVHDVEFKGEDRFCPKCDYKWPPQNYVCSPNTLWWDGFRQPDGTVRQFFFTDEEKRDIASIVIGKKNTVPAFGFAFYEPKKRREEPKIESNPWYFYGGTYSMGTGPNYNNNYNYQIGMPKDSVNDNTFDDGHVNTVFLNNAGSGGSSCNSGYGPVSADCAGPNEKIGPVSARSADPGEKILERKLKAFNASPVPKEVSVGGGAEIKQDLMADTLSVKDWKKKPSALMRLYFVFEDQFAEILKGGIVDLDGKDGGYLDGLPVG